MNLFLLFFEFFKVGMFAVGGGLATLPFLNLLVEKYDWFTATDLANIIAVSESTPGPIGVNMATYTGYTGAGILGGIIATAGIVTPSVIIILIIAKMLEKFNHNRFVKATFSGLRPAVVGLIAAAIIGIMEMSFINQAEVGSVFSLFNYKALGVFLLLTLFRYRFQKMHPIVIILIGAVVGILLNGF